MRHSQLFAPVLLASLAVATPAFAEPALTPFDAAPISDAELSQVTGQGLGPTGALSRLASDQARDIDRWTGSVASVILANWTNDVALPLIASNLIRPDPVR